MPAKVVVPPAVLAEIEAAGVYIAEQGNLTVALTLIDRLEAACASLAEFPERGVPYGTQYRRIFEGRYQIIYRMENSVRVVVVAVHHSSRQEPAGL